MNEIGYTLIRSDRRSLSVQINLQGEVVVRGPKRMPKREIDRFLESRRQWLEIHLANLPEAEPKLTQEEMQTLYRHAKEVLPEVTAFYAPKVGVDYGRITIRSQHTRWGSCSAEGNLNFNCLLMLVPDEVMEYVVVHELCHRREMNHSARFWAEVDRVLPDYRKSCKWLKEHGAALIARLP